MISNSKLWELHFGSKKEVVDYAGREIHKNEYGTNGKYSWDIDHAIPVSQGGTDACYNLLPVHHISNDNKGEKTSWMDEDRRYQVKKFSTLRKKEPTKYSDKGYDYCLLNEDDDSYEVVAYTKDVK